MDRAGFQEDKGRCGCDPGRHPGGRRPAAGGPLRWRSGRGSLAADRQCRPHRLSGVHGLAGGGGTGGDAAVSAAGETGGALPHLQRAAGFPGLRPFCVLRQASGPVHLHRHQLSRTAGGCPGQPLRLRGAAGGRGYPLRRGRRIPGHTGLSGAGLSPFGMACGQKKNCRIAAVLFLG